MKIVAQDGSISHGKWISKGIKYEIVATEGFDHKTSVWDSIDTVKRADGQRHNFRRRELNLHFKEITPLR